MTRNVDELLKAISIAKVWAARGIPAFPIALRNDPTKYDGQGGIDKRPLTPHGHMDATTDTTDLERLFTEARPHHGEIIACGLHPGGGDCTVCDIDIKNGKNGLAVAAHLGLLDTWGNETASGGQHRWYRRPLNLRISNYSPWADDGIDIRGDDGWVVAPGTQTPWGRWGRLEDYSWDTDIQDLPQMILERLDTYTPGTGGSTHRYTERTLTPDDRNKLHPATLAAVEHLEERGAHNLRFIQHDDNEPCVMATRPGKRWGGSASIGKVGPGGWRCFTSNWPGVPEGTWWIEDDGTVVPHRQRKEAARWRPEPAGAPQPGDTNTAPADDTAAPATVKSFDIHDLLAGDDDEYDWLVGKLLERTDRTILTGLEGMGKSTLLRQFALAAAAGIHPFKFGPIDPVRVLYVDLENSRRQIRRKIGAIYHRIRNQIPAGSLIWHIEPSGIDLTDIQDCKALDLLCRNHRPDLLIIGPIYKMHQGDPIEEKPAKQVAMYLDDLRTAHQCALLIEAHTPYAGTSRGSRPERPYGASLWSRWPEFGIFLNETGKLTHWRGPRDEREWPKLLKRAEPATLAADPGAWLWEQDDRAANVKFADMIEHARELGETPSLRAMAAHLNCSHETVRRAIDANKPQWEALKEELGE